MMVHARMLVGGLLTVVAGGWSQAAAADADAGLAYADVTELMARMPEPVVTQPVTITPLVGGIEMAPGVEIIAGERVVLAGTGLFDQGPTDGLESMACLANSGKKHESLVGLTTDNAQLVKAAFIAALDLERDGVAAQELSAVPARGIPVAVHAVWQPDQLLEPDRWVQVPFSCLVRNRKTDQAFPAMPWVWTGSIFEEITRDIPGQGVVKQERFMLEITGNVAVNYDEPHALFASPFPNAVEDVVFEVNSALAPRKGTPVSVVFTSCELPVTLVMNDRAELMHGDQVVDDASLVQLLQQHYQSAPDVEWYAVGVEAAPLGDDGQGVSDRAVLEVRARVLKASIAAGVWVAPVFTLPAD